jgi:hypothetical protein
MDLSGDGLSLVASCPGGSNGEVALTGLVKVLPSQVEYGRKLVMLSLVWMPMIDSVAQSLSRTMARGLLLLRISTMDLGTSSPVRSHRWQLDPVWIRH